MTTGGFPADQLGELVVAFMLGILGTVLVQAFLNRRALFTYNVFHNRIGVTSDDPVYGSVQVLWDNKPVKHQLYLSTVELVNRSTKDFDSVKASVFTNDTDLLTEKAELIDTVHIVPYTDEYQDEIDVPEGESPSDSQVRTHSRRRDYLIPTMNRGQVVRFEFLNAAHSGSCPHIFLDIVHKGVKLKPKAAANKVFGVPQQAAAIVGMSLCAFVIVAMLYFTDFTTGATIAAYILGLAANIPGAYAIRLWWKVQDLWAG